ncbi:hypothetical protein LTR53_019778, partial [Teratosphaeriaceae sp. CCFEE 6253]
MAGALPDPTAHPSVQPGEAVDIGTNLIAHLLAHSDTDPARPPLRKFLETYGPGRTGALERILSDFVTAADALVLDGV